MEIHIARDGEKFGPYTEQEVHDYLADGSLLGSDLAWHDGLETWILLEEVELPPRMKRTPPPPSHLSPRTEPINPMASFLGQAVTPGNPFSASFLNAFIIIPTSLNDDLTRDLAAEILNEQLAEPRVGRLEFIDGGIDRAKADGLVEESPDFSFFGTHTFKGEALPFVSLLKNEIDQIHRPEDDATAVARTPFFELAAPLAQSVEEVTGITAGPLGSRILVVEYIAAYSIPPEMAVVMPYVYTAQRKSAAFQRYDDGWRIVGDV